MNKTPKPLLGLMVGVTLVVGTLSSQAQQLYSQDFEVDQNATGNWVTNANGNSPADLFFDYSTVGIPLAPNSTGGGTHGAKLNANLPPAVAQGGVSVSPLDFSLATDTNFVIHCDWWINFNGPAPGGGNGSTQVGGVGFGTAGSSAQFVGACDGLFTAATGEGGSGFDYRLYTAAFPGSIQPESGAYIAGSLSTSRNNSDPYYSTNFPGQAAPSGQVTAYPQQTGTTAAGSQGWAWRDLKIEKIGPFVTWSIDEIPIAVIDLTTNGSGGSSTFGGDKLVLVHSDINGTASTDVNAAALAFSLFDNLRVSNIVANVVTVTAPNPSAFELGPTPAQFTFTRTIATSAQTVNYTISGTALNGVDYTNALGGALSGTITFAAGVTSTNLDVVPIDDGDSEAAESIVIAAANGVGYVAAGSAQATIADNDPALLTVTVSAGSMYERHTNDYCSVVVSRLGDLGTQIFIDPTNFTFSGATLDVDFVVNSNLFPFVIDPGLSGATNNLVSPLDNSIYSGNKTIIVGLSGGVDFGATSSNAVLTIIDDEHPAATVLYTNALTSSDDATNWNVTYANGDLLTFGATDYEASFGYDLSANASGGGVIAPPPGGANNALRTTVNKNVGNNAGLNLYPTNVSFSGNFAVRFNMNLIIDTAGGTTQGPLFGINHDGQQTNWWAGSGVVSGGPWAADGLWYWISADGGAAAGDYLLFTGTGGALPNTGWQRPATELLDNFTKIFKGPPAPYSGYAGPGLVANDPPIFGAENYNWTDVEITQLGNIVSLYINKIRVLQYVNTTSFTNGTVMLGYSDPFNSIGEAAGAAYYANLSVVEIGLPEITAINRSGSNVAIDFTSNDGTDSSATFALQAAVVVTGPYADVTGAVISQVGPTTYQATTTSAASAQYYRIRKK